jgi:hypothetical protein
MYLIVPRLLDYWYIGGGYLYTEVMKSRLEHDAFGRGRETIEAYAGSVLSRLGVASSVVRARTTGPENADGRLVGVYPLTPLHWEVARTRRRQLATGLLAEHRDVVPERTKVRPYAPKDMPNAGHNSAPLEDLIPQDNDEVPVVYWPYGDRLLAAEIPPDHLVAAVGERFEWTSRFETYGAFGAGRRRTDGTIFAVAAHAIASMPASEVQPVIPAY